MLRLDAWHVPLREVAVVKCFHGHRRWPRCRRQPAGVEVEAEAGVEAEAEADIEAEAELALMFPLVFRRGSGVFPPAACVVTRRCAHALSTVGGLYAWLCALRLRFEGEVKAEAGAGTDTETGAVCLCR